MQYNGSYNSIYNIAALLISGRYSAIFSQGMILVEPGIAALFISGRYSAIFSQGMILVEPGKYSLLAIAITKSRIPPNLKIKRCWMDHKSELGGICYGDGHEFNSL